MILIIICLICSTCRLYGVTPEEVWDERVELLKNRHGVDFPSYTQCGLVTMDDGCKYISSENDNKWFNHVRECEKRLGVTPDAIHLHDLPGGSYRTFHDHLLIELFPVGVLEALTKYRFTNPTEGDIEHVVEEIVDRMEQNNG